MSGAIAPRVLETDDSEGSSLVAVGLGSTDTAQALHREVGAVVEAALLSELARPARVLRQRARRFRFVRLAMFANTSFAMSEAVRAFGLAKTEPRGTSWRTAIGHIRGAAQTEGWAIPDEPVSAWEARIEERPELTRLEDALRDETGEEVWGERPGRPFERLLRHVGMDAAPSLSALREVEPLIVSRSVGPIRWIPPLTFQAFADGVGVAIERDQSRRVEWAVADADEDGLAPPPLLRVDGRVHVPVGMAALRWCVMPLQPGEEPPPLADWVADELGGGPS